MRLTFSEKIIYGSIVLGIGFPIMGIFISLNDFGLNFSLDNVFLIHKKIPALFLIDLAPIVLPLVAWYVTTLAKDESKLAIAKDESENLKKVSQAINSLEDPNSKLEFKFDGKLEGISDSLINLKKTIEYNRKKELEGIWESEGFGKFGEILRNNSNDIEQLSKATISDLVKYTETHFGGFYFLDDSRRKHVINLLGSYAYDFSVKEKQTFDIGEGLVGQCFKDKEVIYLENIPEDYQYNIESGLGVTSPSSILFSPLVANGEIIGVIEIASLHKIEKYKIDFIAKLSESIAVSLVNVKSAEQTKELLEEAQFMSQQMQAQEEELRQNAEEMQATQEEIERKLSETETILSTERKKISSIVNTSSDGIIVVSEKGKLIDYNPSFQELLEYTKTDLKTMALNSILGIDKEITEFIEENLDQVTELLVKTKKENEIWIKISINKMEIENTVSYSMFISDISELKHNLNVMEETVNEFQNLMMEQAEEQGVLQMELEQLKQELEELKK